VFNDWQRDLPRADPGQGQEADITSHPRQAGHTESPSVGV
jgi:hypothetical protein